jgi:GT2 family glycosyltransferase
MVGHTVNALSDNACSEASQLLIDYLYSTHASRDSRRDGADSPAFFTSNNLAVPAHLFRHLRGFDESFPLAGGEDREFCDRWQFLGYRLVYLPRAIVRHAHGLSFARFWRQHVNYGRGAFRLRHTRLARGRPGLSLQPLSFYVRLVGYPRRVAHSGSSARLMALMLTSQVANALGFLLERLGAASNVH